MAITASSNIPSIRAQRQLAKTSDELSRTYQRLSSGLRINNASDDPAGLILADTLDAQTRIASVALRNANDGISLAAVADAGLEQIGEILSRMAELATQSANGVYTNTQRSALSLEFAALGSEIERIAVATTFNNLSLLSASSSITLQVGLTGGSSSTISIDGVLGTLSSLGLAGSGASALSFSIIDLTSSSAQLAAQNALTQVNAAITSVSIRRGILGAAESRLNSAISYLEVVRENFSAAVSRIRDADVAEESARLVRLQVLQQAQTAVLAQANQQPKRVLDLLG